MQKTFLFLHLAWHDKLKNDSGMQGHFVEKDFFWVDPPFPKKRLRNVAAFCRRVWQANGNRIPYAFSKPSGFFNPKSGKLETNSSKVGLTCSTFVIEVFRAVGVVIVNDHTWPTDRPEDIAMQRDLLKLLRLNGASEEHCSAVESQIPCLRVRAEEVAAACTRWPVPVDFGYCENLTSQLLQIVNNQVESK